MAYKHVAVKIRFPNNTFSRGGASPDAATASTRGKIWGSAGALSNHLTLVTNTWAEEQDSSTLSDKPHPYRDAVLVDLISQTEVQLDVQASIERLIAKLVAYCDQWDSELNRSKIFALRSYCEINYPKKELTEATE